MNCSMMGLIALVGISCYRSMELSNIIPLDVTIATSQTMIFDSRNLLPPSLGQGVIESTRLRIQHIGIRKTMPPSFVGTYLAHFLTIKL
jgi:hypothetical protein